MITRGTENIALVVFLPKKAQHKSNHVGNTGQSQWRDSLEKKWPIHFTDLFNEKTCLITQ